MSDYETFMIILTTASLIVSILTYIRNSRPVPAKYSLYFSTNHYCGHFKHHLLTVLIIKLYISNNYSEIMLTLSLSSRKREA